MTATTSSTKDAARAAPSEDPVPAEPLALNEIRLRGRVSAGPSERELPSGARVVTLRLVVGRGSTVMTRGSKQSSDWMECSAWSGELRRRLARWQPGDIVEVTGALRRRHYRAAHGASSVVEVEVLGGRRVQRAPASRAAAP